MGKKNTIPLPPKNSHQEKINQINQSKGARVVHSTKSKISVTCRSQDIPPTSKSAIPCEFSTIDPFFKQSEYPASKLLPVNKGTGNFQKRENRQKSSENIRPPFFQQQQERQEKRNISQHRKQQSNKVQKTGAELKSKMNKKNLNQGDIVYTEEKDEGTHNTDSDADFHGVGGVLWTVNGETFDNRIEDKRNEEINEEKSNMNPSKRSRNKSGEQKVEQRKQQRSKSSGKKKKKVKHNLSTNRERSQKSNYNNISLNQINQSTSSVGRNYAQEKNNNNNNSFIKNQGNNQRETNGKTTGKSYSYQNNAEKSITNEIINISVEDKGIQGQRNSQNSKQQTSVGQIGRSLKEKSVSAERNEHQIDRVVIENLRRKKIQDMILRQQEEQEEKQRKERKLQLQIENEQIRIKNAQRFLKQQQLQMQQREREPQVNVSFPWGFNQQKIRSFIIDQQAREERSQERIQQLQIHQMKCDDSYRREQLGLQFMNMHPRDINKSSKKNLERQISNGRESPKYINEFKLKQENSPYHQKSKEEHQELQSFIETRKQKQEEQDRHEKYSKEIQKHRISVNLRKLEEKIKKHIPNGKENRISESIETRQTRSKSVGKKHNNSQINEQKQILKNQRQRSCTNGTIESTSYYQQQQLHSSSMADLEFDWEALENAQDNDSKFDQLNSQFRRILQNAILSQQMQHQQQNIQQQQIQKQDSSVEINSTNNYNNNNNNIHNNKVNSGNYIQNQNSSGKTSLHSFITRNSKDQSFNFVHSPPKQPIQQIESRKQRIFEQFLLLGPKFQQLCANNHKMQDHFRQIELQGQVDQFDNNEEHDSNTKYPQQPNPANHNDKSNGRSLIQNEPELLAARGIASLVSPRDVFKIVEQKWKGISQNEQTDQNNNNINSNHQDQYKNDQLFYNQNEGLMYGQNHVLDIDEMSQNYQSDIKSLDQSYKGKSQKQQDLLHSSQSFQDMKETSRQQALISSSREGYSPVDELDEDEKHNLLQIRQFELLAQKDKLENSDKLGVVVPVSSEESAQITKINGKNNNNGFIVSDDRIVEAAIIIQKIWRGVQTRRILRYHIEEDEDQALRDEIGRYIQQTGVEYTPEELEEYIEMIKQQRFQSWSEKKQNYQISNQQHQQGQVNLKNKDQNGSIEKEANNNSNNNVVHSLSHSYTLTNLQTEEGHLGSHKKNGNYEYDQGCQEDYQYLHNPSQVAELDHSNSDKIVIVDELAQSLGQKTKGYENENRLLRSSDIFISDEKYETELIDTFNQETKIPPCDGIADNKVQGGDLDQDQSSKGGKRQSGNRKMNLGIVIDENEIIVGPMAPQLRKKNESNQEIKSQENREKQVLTQNYMEKYEGNEQQEDNRNQLKEQIDINPHEINQIQQVGGQDYHENQRQDLTQPGQIKGEEVHNEEGNMNIRQDTGDISDELFEEDENYVENADELYEGEEEYEMDLDYLLGKSLYEEEDGTVFILENNEKIFLSTEDVAMIDEYARQKQMQGSADNDNREFKESNQLGNGLGESATQEGFQTELEIQLSNNPRPSPSDNLNAQQTHLTPQINNISHNFHQQIYNQTNDNVNVNNQNMEENHNHQQLQRETIENPKGYKEEQVLKNKKKEEELRKTKDEQVKQWSDLVKMLESYDQQQQQVDSKNILEIIKAKSQENIRKLLKEDKTNSQLLLSQDQYNSDNSVQDYLNIELYSSKSEQGTNKQFLFSSLSEKRTFRGQINQEQPSINSGREIIAAKHSIFEQNEDPGKNIGNEEKQLILKKIDSRKSEQFLEDEMSQQQKEPFQEFAEKQLIQFQNGGIEPIRMISSQGMKEKNGQIEIQEHEMRSTNQKLEENIHHNNSRKWDIHMVNPRKDTSEEGSLKALSDESFELFDSNRLSAFSSSKLSALSPSHHSSVNSNCNQVNIKDQTNHDQLDQQQLLSHKISHKVNIEQSIHQKEIDESAKQSNQDGQIQSGQCSNNNLQSTFQVLDISKAMDMSEEIFKFLMEEFIQELHEYPQILDSLLNKTNNTIKQETQISLTHQEAEFKEPTETNSYEWRDNQGQLDQTKTEGIDTNISSVERYLKGLSDFIINDQIFLKSVTDKLNTSLGPSAIEMLKLFHFVDPQETDNLKQDEDIPANHEGVLSTEIYSSFEMKILADKNLSFYPNDLVHFHNKAIFDSFNEALDSYRLFGLSGPPFPWRITSNKIHTFQITTSQTQEVLSSAIRLVMQWAKFLCGIIFDKHLQSLSRGGILVLTEEIMQQTKDKHLQEMINAEAKDQEHRWINYDDEHTEIQFELSEMIFDELISQAALELYNLSNLNISTSSSDQFRFYQNITPEQNMNGQSISLCQQEIPMQLNTFPINQQ